jgi:hypothetical protein
MRRYYQPPCSTGTSYRHTSVATVLAQDVLVPVAFQCPFVDYQNDIFVVQQIFVLGRARTGHTPDENAVQQPLIGFDMSRIEHLGWLDSMCSYNNHPAKNMPLASLTALKDLAILEFVDERPEEMLGSRYALDLNFSLQPWEGWPSGWESSRTTMFRRGSRALSSKRIQSVLWHAKSGIKIILWHYLQHTLDDPALELMAEWECSCSLGSRHTVPLENEVIPLKWMRIVPIDIKDRPAT